MLLSTFCPVPLDGVTVFLFLGVTDYSVARIWSFLDQGERFGKARKLGRKQCRQNVFNEIHRFLLDLEYQEQVKPD